MSLNTRTLNFPCGTFSISEERENSDIDTYYKVGIHKDPNKNYCSTYENLIGKYIMSRNVQKVEKLLSISKCPDFSCVTIFLSNDNFSSVKSYFETLSTSLIHYFIDNINKECDIQWAVQILNLLNNVPRDQKSLSHCMKSSLLFRSHQTKSVLEFREGLLKLGCQISGKFLWKLCYNHSFSNPNPFYPSNNPIVKELAWFIAHGGDTEYLRNSKRWSDFIPEHFRLELLEDVKLYINKIKIVHKTSTKSARNYLTCT